MHNRVALQEY